ncbi:MAG: hypothetical protein IKZ71_00350 [Bacteroidales bacterium]|nr:hypothetical protein [Bacteroidales bacterium]
MKKIYVLIAVAALVLSAASCGNKKAKEAAAEPAAQEVAAEPTAAEEVKDAAQEAAVDVAKEAIAAGAEAVKDEIKK